MESSTAVEAPDVQATEEPGTPPDNSQGKIFKYSQWVHVGHCAEGCSHGEDGKCDVAGHFHAWCRLPNKFQVTDIREKAQAARARVLRQATDPDSDRSAIIDNQLAEVRAQGEEAMVEELLARNTFKWTQRAMSEVAEGEEGSEEESEFAHVEEDQRRFAEMSAQDPEERDASEYKELIDHLEKWNDEVEKTFAELQRPEKESLEARDLDELEKMLREQVVAEQANQVFMRVFSKWQYATCTQRPNSKGHMQSVFENVGQLEAEAPEVIEALETAYKELESTMADRSSVRAEGNS